MPEARQEHLHLLRASSDAASHGFLKCHSLKGIKNCKVGSVASHYTEIEDRRFRPLRDLFTCHGTSTATLAFYFPSTKVCAMEEPE